MSTNAISTNHVFRSISDIQYRPPASLKPWKNNPRFHGEQQLTRLVASIREFGFTAPLLIDEDDTILSGHGRVAAATRLGLVEIPVRVAVGWTKSQKRSFVVADNKLALLSEWNPNLLKSELELLIADNEVNIDITAFSTAEIDFILSDDGASDDPGELRAGDISAAPPVSRLGDHWFLGNHRLLCADSLDPKSFAALLGSDRAQMCITDPPYNVPIDGHVGGNGKIKHREFAMASGEMTSVQFVKFLNCSGAHIRAACQDGAICYFFMDWRHLPELHAAVYPLFGPPRQLCVWNKESGGMGTFYRSQHEMIYVFKKGDAPHINNFELGQHGRYRTNIWSYPGINSGQNRELLALHPTVKPVSLIADAIRDCSHRQGIVLDPFAGSGTVLVAAERTGRRARAIELDPQYVDVGIHRWQRLTGKQATLAATGQTWDQVRVARLSSLATEVSHVEQV